MKKILCILATLSIAFVSYADKATEDQINRAKAIAAYHVNKLSKPERFTENTCPKDMTIEKIQEKIKDLEDNKRLTDFIAKSKPQNEIDSSVFRFYSETLFEESVFFDFFKKQPDRKEKLHNMLGNELADILNMGTQKNETPKQEKQLQESKTTKDSDPRESRQPRSGLIPALSLLLAVLAMGAAVFLYMLFVKMKNMLQDLRISNNHRKEEIDSLKQRIDRLEGDSLKSRNMMTEMQRKVTENTKSIQSASTNGQQTVGGGRPFASTQRPVETVKEYYAGVPFDGCFKANENYSTKMLYKLTTRGEAVGEFEFVNRSEAVAIAQQSKTSFLDPACNIVNDDIASFSSIVTEQKGKIEKTDNGWKITQKAVIRLA
ncbi:MAG: hypothetical protein J5711_01280 [Bacteroidales bacterium]|nr:hypothetical protein [Bacteroidales bacterium]